MTTKTKKPKQQEPQGILQEYAAKTLRKRELEAEKKALDQELEQLEKLALDELRDRGEQSVKLATGPTVYLDKKIWASLVNDENGSKTGAQRALKRAKLGYLVNPYVHVQSLSAYVREVYRDGNDLPPSVRPWVKVTEEPRVVVRSG